MSPHARRPGCPFGRRFVASLALAIAGALALPGSASPARAEDRAAPAARYRLEPVPADLAQRFDAAQRALLEKLNRADARYLARFEAIVVPERWDGDESEHSPLPQEVPALAAHAKALVVHQPIQAFAAYEHGRLVRWGPVSSGRREHETPAGRFHLNWRSRARHSTVDPSWHMEWYFNFHNERGLALHQYALPGRPASHACIRLLERDARWIYEWGEGWELDARGQEVVVPGTPLWILGRYDFERPPPWLREDGPHPAVEIRLEEAGEEPPP